jgi:hypothetical protein
MGEMTGQSVRRLASRALRRQDFNHPPIPIGGIRHKSQPAFRRQDFNHPPISIGGIRHKSQPAFRRQDFNHPPISIGGISVGRCAPLKSHRGWHRFL